MGLAHITGGGLVDNPPRIFPDGLGAVLSRHQWQVPPIFHLIQELGGVEDSEMYHVFNMGLGLLAIVPQEQVEAATQYVPEARQVGRIVSGVTGVSIEP